MTNARARTSIAGAVLCLAAVGASGCAETGPSHGASAGYHQSAAPSAKAKPAELRSALDRLLTEHLNLAAAATGAALDGRQSEFQAAAAALDENSIAISQAVGSVYGAGVEQKFLPLWREHIDMLVSYTVGAATGDSAKQDEAVGQLMEYTVDFANFLSTANPDLPRQAVADILKTHVITLKAIVDAQTAKNPAATFAAQHAAHDHMSVVAVALAETIVQQFPHKFQ